MGTKNNPGKFDCYANAKPDEPVFVLLGRDPAASATIEFWTVLRQHAIEDEKEKLAEARACSEAMARYAQNLGKTEQVRKVLKLVDGILVGAKLGTQ